VRVFNRKSQIANRKSLKGDLDNIVLMAMRKEPSRRYASVDQLANDIRRHLHLSPVPVALAACRTSSKEFMAIGFGRLIG